MRRVRQHAAGNETFAREPVQVGSRGAVVPQGSHVITAQSVDEHEYDQWVALRIETHLDAGLQGEDELEGQ
jgi:hypothetical protein